MFTDLITELGTRDAEAGSNDRRMGTVATARAPACPSVTEQAAGKA